MLSRESGTALYTKAFFLSFKIRYVPVLYSHSSSLWYLPCQNDRGKKWFIHLEINLSTEKEREILDVHAKKALR
jgi:hypothetical protein